MSKTPILLLVFVFLFACKNPAGDPSEGTNTNQDRELLYESDENTILSTAETIALKHGVDHWDQVNEIAFTFNIDRAGNHFERSFIWKPKTQQVTYMSSTDTVAYNRNEPLDSVQLLADKRFINDKYWMLSPFHLVWDKGTTISEEEQVVAPISKDTLNKITLLYGDEGGYTPGDGYDFYYGDDFMVREWVFREGNDPGKTMTNTFEDYANYNGLNIARMHQDSTGGFKLYFTNISVK